MPSEVLRAARSAEDDSHTPCSNLQWPITTDAKKEYFNASVRKTLSYILYAIIIFLKFLFYGGGGKCEFPVYGGSNVNCNICSSFVSFSL